MHASECYLTVPEQLMATQISSIILVENHSTSPSLAAEHGISICLVSDSHQTIFDTGQTGLFADNASNLGIDLAATDHLVLSHGHFDHTGGIPRFFQEYPSPTVYAHPAVTLKRYSIKKATGPRMIGMSESSQQVLESMNVSWVQEPKDITDQLKLTGPIPRTTEYEDVGGPFFLDSLGQNPDPITDDQALWFKAKQGLVIILGCAHAGVINTINYCRRLSGIAKVHAVIGGFHLINADQERMKQTIRALRVLNPDILAACHCTGPEATKFLKQSFPQSFKQCHTGSIFQFDAI